MNSYELTVILRNKEVEPLIEKVKGILTKHEVSIIQEVPWGVRKLAYEIDKEREGYYQLLHIDSPPEAIQTIISEFRLNRDILRQLFVKMKKKPQA
ncbi:MAG: 30S ribosomal protein S6 [bacterium]|nr:30S ribosomal protein S6 [bacterium]